MPIKPEADEIYFSKHPEQRELALHLGEAFNVNFGDSFEQLSFWLLEPQQHTKERFGLQREVLAIYSPFPKTDARVITAASQITTISDLRHRVEKVLIVLVHRGDAEEVASLVKDQKDFIVVPIAASELRNRERGNLFVRSRLSEAIGSIDLFGMSSPITSDKYFFGRDELVQALISRSIQGSESSGLFGLRKTGKTSVLYAVQRRLADRPVVAVYVDCQNPGTHGLRWWELLELLVARCRDVLRFERRRTARISAEYSRSNAGSRFTSDVLALLRDGQIEHIIFMLDEIEYITPGLSGAIGQHWDEDFSLFWQTVRAVKQETQGRVSFIVAGVNPACVESPSFGSRINPIFQLAIPQYLQPLSVGDVRDMVRTIARYSGIKVAEDVYSYLAERYGGHPYLVRIACSEVWMSSGASDPIRKIEVRVLDFEKKADDIKNRLAQPIKDILLSLVWWYADEYDLLRIIAAGDSGFVDEYLSVYSNSIAQFIRYGLLRGRGGEFAIADLRDFLREHGESYKTEISPFLRGDMPADLLPEVPDINLLGRLFERRTEIEILLRKIIVMYLGVRYSWRPEKIAEAMIEALPKKKDRPRPEQLFVGRTPNEVIQELYTPDLKAIIIENWEVFGGLFDSNRARLEMNLDTINRARRVDAHTKPVTEDEALEFENSYLWLKNRLKKVPV